MPQLISEIPLSKWNTIARTVAGVCGNIDALEQLFRKENRPEGCIWTGGARNLYRPYKLKTGQDVDIRLCFQDYVRSDEEYGGADALIIMALCDGCDFSMVSKHYVRANSTHPSEPDMIYDERSRLYQSELTLDDIVEVLKSIKPYIDLVEKQKAQPA